MTKINIINDLIRACPFDENESYVEVDDETLNNIMMGKIVARKGKLVDVSQEIAAKQRIQELIKLLESTDYIDNKLAEAIAEFVETGDNTNVLALRLQYAKELSDRQSWRDEINELEKQLKE